MFPAAVPAARCAFSIALTCILSSLAGCGVPGGSTARTNPASAAAQSELAVELQSNDAGGGESAHVEGIALTCGEETRAMALSASVQKAVVSVDLAGCQVSLETFVVNRDGAVVRFRKTDRSAQGFVAFDAEDRPETVLVSSEQSFVQGCTENCRGGYLKARFVYSELLAEKIGLKHVVKPPKPPKPPHCRPHQSPGQSPHQGPHQSPHQGPHQSPCAKD